MTSEFKKKIGKTIERHCTLMATNPAYKYLFNREIALVNLELVMRANGASQDEIDRVVKSYRIETMTHIKSITET